VAGAVTGEFIVPGAEFVAPELGCVVVDGLVVVVLC
jgi:hypothetical protein